MSALKKIALFPLVRLVWALLLLIGINWAFSWLFPGVAVLPGALVSGGIRNALISLVVLWATVHWFEGKGLQDVGLGLRRAPGDLARGLLLGALGPSLVVGILAVLGNYHVDGLATAQGSDTGPTLTTAFLAIPFLAASEELKTRGILFRQLEQGLGTWIAIGGSALLFGFAHWRNPGATTFSSLAIASEGGVLLAGAYVATRSLWLPIGIHWAWNLFEGPVWDSPVSGNVVSSLVQARFTGSSLLTGGAFGLEAGLPAIVLGTAAGIAFLAMAVRRRAIFTPPWMLRLLGHDQRPAPGVSPPVA